MNFCELDIDLMAMNQPTPPMWYSMQVKTNIIPVIPCVFVKSVIHSGAFKVYPHSFGTKEVLNRLFLISISAPYAQGQP